MDTFSSTVAALVCGAIEDFEAENQVTVSQELKKLLYNFEWGAIIENTISDVVNIRVLLLTCITF
jgi:hypothetical protein